MKKKTLDKMPLKVLYLEDSLQDIEIIRELLIDAGFDLTMDCTDKKKEFSSFLRNHTYDVILSDFKLPGFDAFGALQVSNELCPNIPFICISGSIGEEIAIELIKKGAIDYILKDRLVRLPLAITRALNEVKEKETLQKAEAALHESEKRFRSMFEDSPISLWEENFSDVKKKMDRIRNSGIKDLRTYFNDHPEEVAECVTLMKIVSTNRATLQLYEANNFEELVAGLSTVFGKESYEIFSEELIAFSEGKTSFETETINYTLTGKKINIYLKWTLVAGYEDTLVKVLVSILDITERKQAEKQIALLAHTLKSVAECVSITDLNDIVLFVNNAFLKTYGYTEREMLGKNINIVRSPNTPPGATSGILAATLKGGWRGELMNRTKDGRDFPVSFSTSFVRDELGQDIALVGIATDIAERKQAQEELKKSEGKFQAIFDNASDGMFLVDLNLRKYFICNSMCVKMLGYTQEEFSTLDIDDIHPSENLPFINEQIGKFSRGEEGIRSDIRFKRKDDSIFEADIRPALLTIAEKKYLLISFTDITERKKANEELKKSKMLLESVINSSEDLILVVDRNLRIQMSNWKSPLYAGCTEFPIGSHCYEAFIHRDTPCEPCHVIGVFNTGEPICAEYYNQYTKLFKEVNAYPIFDDNNNVTMVVEDVRDITERKRAEEVIRESEERFRMVFENVFDGISIYSEDPDPSKRKLIECNEQYAAMAGRSREELIRLGSTLGLQRTLENEANENRLESLTRKTAFQGSFSWIRPDGKDNIIEYVGMPITWRGESYSIGIDREITERMRAEQALRKNESILSDAMRIANLATWEYDVARDEFTFNDQFYALFRTTVEREGGYCMSSKSYAQKFVYPDDMAMVGVEIQKALQTDNPSYYSRLDHRIIYGDGEMGYITVHIRIEKDAQGRTIKTHGVNQDITERMWAEETIRQSEERFHTIFNNVQDVYYETSMDGTIIEVSPSIEIMSEGQYKREDLIGHTIDEFYSVVEERHAFLKLLKEQGSVSDFEITLRNRDGSFIPCSISSKIFFHAHDRSQVILGSMRDISKRKRADEALAKERTLLRTLIDALPERIYAKDSERRFILNNIAHLNALGAKSQEEAIGKTDYDFRSKEDADMYLASDLQVLETGRPIIGTEFPSVSVSGGAGWMLTTSVPLKDAQGNIIGLVGNSHDITERKNMLDSLRKLSLAVEQNPSAVIITNVKGEIEYINPKFTGMTGYSKEEVIGKNPRILKTEHRTSEEYREMWETILSGKEWRGKFQNRKKDGSLFWVSAQISPIVDDACEILNFLALEEDITHQKEITEALTESEDRYRRLVEHSPDAIAVYSDGAFAFVNPAAVQLFGAQYESQLIGKQIVNFIQPESRKFAQERIQAILENEKPLPIVEEKYLKVDGTAIDVEVASLPILLGKKSAVQVIIRDITEKKKIQSQLLQTQKVESIGTLAGGIAHDFNNILGIVVAYTSILQRVEGDKKKFENSIDAINKAVSRGAALVRQILTFARQTEISIKQMSVPELAHEVVTMLQETFPKLIEFKEVFERGIPLINADHSQIHQAVLNLCVNARDAMPQGGVITVKIDVRPLEEVKQRFPTASFNRYVRLSISDTGTGMNESTKKRIFDPFFTTKELGKGTGLGLSVVYGVMQSHYGFVSVESEFGQGTTFYLFLPVPQEIKKDHGEPVSKGIGTHRGTETILFVEDEELLRTAVASTLESNGYTVYTAVDGRQAVDVYKQYRKEIALVVTDMGLPKLSGMDVFLRLREINPTLKIILASGFISIDQKSELLKAGASEFIQKPYLLSEVLEKIRGALNEKNE